ncbi:MAG TPA: EutN/CcmL family microcompartment protein [Planctomycetota bacterium]|mgnify:CR=1 FL=1|jgi:ethanolamine utilization protein EutN|nr:EutN/CcmL family microcompartment protein [Planctomycetota bacterium]
MILARVTGVVHATLKNKHLQGHRLLVVRPINAQQKPDGMPILCIDRVDSGPGDLVIVCREGGGVRIVLKNARIPVQAMIVAIVDGVDMEATS